MITQEILNFGNHLANLASEISKKYFRFPNGEVAKEDDSPVTKADREIEKIWREEISKNFPSHGIIGEEFGNQNENAELVWILDPIDGTSSFIVGRPIFGNLIALTHQKKSIFGIMNQPITNERWIGIDDPKNPSKNGSWLNGKKIKTRNCQKLEDAVMCSGSSFYFQDGDEELLKKLSSLTKYQKIGGVIYGGDCYSYGSLALGLVDIVIDPGLKVYDYAALMPIIKRAGGVVTEWTGNDPKLKSNVRLVACANKKIHSEVLKVIKNF